MINGSVWGYYIFYEFIHEIFESNDEPILQLHEIIRRGANAVLSSLQFPFYLRQYYIQNIKFEYNYIILASNGNC